MNYNPDFKKFSLYEDESQIIVATGGTIVINYDDIELSEEELKAAILEGKKRKWFHERNKEYWDSQEKPKYEQVPSLTKSHPGREAKSANVHQ